MTFKRFLQDLRILPRWVILAIDLLILAVSALMGYLLRFNFSSTDLLHNSFASGILIYTSCGLISILITNSYKGIIRYTGLQDGVRIVYMILANAVIVTLVNVVCFYFGIRNMVPYSVLLISLLSSFLLLFNYRLLVKYIFSFYRSILIKRSRILIFGAGQTGVITKHVVFSTPRMEVVGFAEDDRNKVGNVIDGTKIYPAQSQELERLLHDLAIDELIITVKDISLDRKNELVDLCIRNQVKVRSIPPVEKWVRGELSLNQIREVNIEELLGREAIRLRDDHIEHNLAGKKILISGAAGSIGSEIVRQVVQYRPSFVVLIDQAESALYELERELARLSIRIPLAFYLADITNRERIEAIFKAHNPDIVYHAAAYKHVPVMESNPAEAIMCNVLGTKIMADLAVASRVSTFVMISTDKAVNPTNVMGCSKRIGEIYVQSLNKFQNGDGTGTSFITTRFGNVLGSNGSVIPLFKQQIKSGGPVTVTHPEVTRYFMTIPEACQLVIEAGIMGNGGEIYIFDMGSSVKIHDLAKKMIYLSGLEPGREIDIVFTGLREGEKLYEELLNKHENTIPTHHPKIMIANVKEYSYEEINRYVDLFYDLVNDRNELKMVALMKELVPEYKSNYSRFEVLDNRD